MMCYRDRTWCGSKVAVHTCGREFTEQDRLAAIKWWGGEDFPLSVGDFCGTEQDGHRRMAAMDDRFWLLEQRYKLLKRRCTRAEWEKVKQEQGDGSVKVIAFALVALSGFLMGLAVSLLW